MKSFALLICSLCPTIALAQDVSGSARAIDGDSLDMSGIIIRLHGIDAPEYRQTCDRSGTPWACGKAAADKLSLLIRGAEVHCQQHDLDKHGRTVATCRSGGVDLAAAMIDAGLAVALPHYSDQYVAGEARARAARIGIWGANFQQPADYRAAHPRPQPRTQSTAAAPRAAAPVTGSGTYYPNCGSARAARAAPLHRGQPGYRPEMDGDGDGIACEPYYGR